MVATTAKRAFTDEDVQNAIRAAAIHCAWVLNTGRGLRVSGAWTDQELIDSLQAQRPGTRRIHPANQSFSAIGSASSISNRLENLFQAIHGNPSRQWLFYWTKRYQQMDIAKWQQKLLEHV